MTALEMIAECRRSCPEQCHECTVALIDALERYFLAAERQDAERIAELEANIKGTSDYGYGLYLRLLELRAKLEAVSKERDELAAQVEVMRCALESIATPEKLQSHGDPVVLRIYALDALRTLPSTPSDATREVKAQTLEEVSLHKELFTVRDYLQERAASPKPPTSNSTAAGVKPPTYTIPDLSTIHTPYPAQEEPIDTYKNPYSRGEFY